MHEYIFAQFIPFQMYVSLSTEDYHMAILHSFFNSVTQGFSSTCYNDVINDMYALTYGNYSSGASSIPIFITALSYTLIAFSRSC